MEGWGSRRYSAERKQKRPLFRPLEPDPVHTGEGKLPPPPHQRLCAFKETFNSMGKSMGGKTTILEVILVTMLKSEVKKTIPMIAHFH
jgi:hypothetical protein